MDGAHDVLAFSSQLGLRAPRQPDFPNGRAGQAAGRSRM